MGRIGCGPKLWGACTSGRQRWGFQTNANPITPVGRATGNRAASGGHLRAGRLVGTAAGAGTQAGGQIDAVPSRPRLLWPPRPPKTPPTNR